MLRPLALALLAGTALVPAALSAQALPTGGTVAAGTAQIGSAQTGGLAINQTSQRAVIDWQSFSVGQGGHVDIVQPNAAAALLNRVTGSATSTIAGQITANGQVYLINPNGIVITKTGSVNAAGFVASTLDISNADFMAGRMNFAGTGGSVANAGTIAIVRGGYAALLGGKVDNSGYIAAPLGRVGLGAAARATLDLAGDGFLQVTLPTTTDGGVAMSGRISADGGTVLIATADARDAARHTVNLSGVIEARGLAGRTGSVTLTGGDVALTGATIDVSGTTGGGSIRIGGNRQGGGTLAHAANVSIDAGSTLRADATGSGVGGQVTIWSDDSTDFAGTISARGAGGAGGDAEVSSAGLLAYRGTADLRGTSFGTLLLDPYNVTISTAADAGHDGSFTATAADSNINNVTLENALGTANVTVSTGTGGAQAGNITVSAPLTWNTSATLTLQAANNITLNSSIATQTGGLTLTAGGAITSPGTISVALFTLTSGAFSQNGTLPAFFAGDFRLLGGTFVRAAGGDGSAGNPYLLTDIYGVQGAATQLASSYQLINDIDASGTTYWNGGLGFSPIGANNHFTGTFFGDGHAIVGLTINRPSDAAVGLFSVNDGTVRAVGLSGGSVTGNYLVGGLIGLNRHQAVQLYSDAVVTGVNSTGGIVGYNEGQITDSFAFGRVNGNAYTGGLVGQNVNDLPGTTATIATSWSSAVVSGSSAGGLVGNNAGGLVNNSYWDTETSGQATSAGGTGLTTAQARMASSYAGFDFTNVWYQSGTLRPLLRSRAGTATGGVTSVADIVQLQLLAANTGGRFAIVNDIDASATKALNPAGLFGSDGFEPIASGGNFTGVLNGNSHLVSNLVINGGSSNNVGLFSSLNNATIANLALRNVTVTGQDDVGAVAGFVAGGSILEASATGQVTGNDDVGGLVGYTMNSAIADSQSGVAVVASGGVGGLVGVVNTSTITRSSATGSVQGSTYEGGLVGVLAATSRITDSYSTASVLSTTTDPGGGLVGLNNGTIATSYASGAVSGAYGGGLIGTNNGTITNSYWDTATTGRNTAAYAGSSTGATGLSPTNASENSRSQSAYVGFNFANVWYQTGDSRPFLRSEGHTAAGGVTAVDSLAGLELMGTNLAGNYVVTENIDASASSGSAAGVFGTTGFVPVGFSTGNTFTGTFNGQGHTITGLTVNRPTTDGIGLFGYSNGATLQNVTLSGGSVAGDRYVGGLVGNATNTTVAYVTNSGTVSGSGTDIGGLVGLLNYANTSNTAVSIIHDSSTTGAVSGGIHVGGLVGDNEGSTLQWTYATGAVSGMDDVGGLIGYQASGNVSTSYALGAVTASGIYVGGFVGDSVQASVILQAYAQGNVKGLDFVGGFAGNIDGGGSITQAYSANKVATTSSTPVTHVGAFAGENGLAQQQATTLTYTYYDSTLAAGLPAIGTSNGTTTAMGLATMDAQDFNNYQANYIGFDFANIWVPPNRAGQDGIATAHYPEFGRLTKAVVVRPVTATRVYGNVNPALVEVYSYIQPGDFVTSQGAINTSATLTSPVGTYGLTVSNVTIAAATPPAYRIVTLPGVLTVTQRPLLVTGGLINVVYGGTIPSTTTSVNPQTGTSTSGVGLVNGDTIGSVSVTNPTATSTSNVGTYAYTPANAVFTSGSASNYLISYANGPLQIVARAVTVTPDGQTRVYGDANPTSGTATTTGLVNGDMISMVQLTSPATMQSPVGAYDLMGSNATFSQGSASNYAITYVTRTGGLTVTARPITVTADAQSRVYGNVNPTLTYTVGGRGLVNGDMLTGMQATTAGLTSNVGTYAITQGTLAASNNYSVTYTGNTLTVTPRPLTIGGGTLSRAYGDANPTTTTSLTVAQGTSTSGSGLVNGDAVGSAAVTNATATQTSNVGNYAYTPANAQFSAGSAANYAISYVNGVLQVTPRALIVTPDATSRVYGDANPTTGTATGDNLVNGDTIASVSLTSPATMQSPVGAYDLTGSNAMFGMGQASNYAITYATRSGGLAVTPRPITVTADPQSRVYGNANPALTYVVSGRGLVNGDTLSGMLTTPATVASPVGSYAINQGSLAATSNYALTYVGNTLMVTPRALTITPVATSRVYGDANPASGAATGDNLVNGDTIASVSLSSPATVQSNVGNYDLTGSNALGSGLSNYTITYATLAGGLAVTPRPITVTADNKARLYGDANPALTYTVGGRGLVNGDMLPGALTTPATTTSPVGGYAINQGSVAASANYTLTYVAGTLTVGPRPLSIAPTPVTTTYGDAPPTTGTPVPTGLVNGDTVTTITLTTPATVTSPVGSYALVPSNAVGTGLTNYTITYVTLPTGLTIAARPITIAALPASRVYGDANPTLTYTVGGRGLANGDTLSGALATTATVTSGIGTYAITLGSLASGNYAITGFTGNVLAVTARPLLVTADNQYRLIGQPLGTLTYTVGGRGLVNGDSLTGMLTTSATSAGPVGLYPISQGSLAASANYALTFVPGTLILTGVTPAQVSTLAGSVVRDVVESSYVDHGIANLIVLTDRAGTLGFESVEPVLSTTCPRTAPCPDDVKTSGTGTRVYHR